MKIPLLCFVVVFAKNSPMLSYSKRDSNVETSVFFSRDGAAAPLTIFEGDEVVAPVRYDRV